MAGLLDYSDSTNQARLERPISPDEYGASNSASAVNGLTFGHGAQVVALIGQALGLGSGNYSAERDKAQALLDRVGYRADKAGGLVRAVETLIGNTNRPRGPLPTDPAAGATGKNGQPAAEPMQPNPAMGKSASIDQNQMAMFLAALKSRLQGTQSAPIADYLARLHQNASQPPMAPPMPMPQMAAQPPTDMAPPPPTGLARYAAPPQAVGLPRDRAQASAPIGRGLSAYQR